MVKQNKQRWSIIKWKLLISLTRKQGSSEERRKKSYWLQGTAENLCKRIQKITTICTRIKKISYYTVQEQRDILMSSSTIQRNSYWAVREKK